MMIQVYLLVSVEATLCSAMLLHDCNPTGHGASIVIHLKSNPGRCKSVKYRVTMISETMVSKEHETTMCWKYADVLFYVSF